MDTLNAKAADFLKEMDRTKKLNSDDLYYLSKIETDLMILNAKVTYCLDDDEKKEVDSDAVSSLINQFENIGQNVHRVLSQKGFSNAHPLINSIYAQANKTSFRLFFNDGFDSLF